MKTKKLLLIPLIALLGACGTKDTTTTTNEPKKGESEGQKEERKLSVISPAGAPAVAMSYLLNSDKASFETTSKPALLKGYFAGKNYDVIVAPTDVGVKAIQDPELGACLEFEFNQACSPFYAMYYLSSGMYAPVPEDFIKALGGGDLAEGVATWGKSSADGSLSPKDTWLSTGPYVVEQWDKDQQIVFGRNNNVNDGKHYKIKGVHVNILAAAGTDPEAALNEFLANKLHAVAVPSTKLEQYKTDPRTTMTTDSSTYKLNLNTCDEFTWESLFGVNGSVMQTPKSQYWISELFYTM